MRRVRSWPMLAVLTAVVLAAVWLPGCAKMPDVKTEPVAAIAAYGTKIADGTLAIENLVIKLNETKINGQPIIPDAQAIEAMKVFFQIGIGVQGVADALTEIDAAISSADKATAAGKVKIGLATLTALLDKVVAPVTNSGAVTQISALITEAKDLIALVLAKVLVYLPSVPSPAPAT